MDEKERKAYDKQYHSRPEYKEQQKLYNKRYTKSGKQRQKWLEYRNRNALFVASYKAERGCLVCPEDCSACLTFHHNGTKEKEVSRLVAEGASIARIEQEIERCVVLCHNCHNKLNVGLIVIENAL